LIRFIIYSLWIYGNKSGHNIIDIRIRICYISGILNASRFWVSSGENNRPGS
jgi:hypothetical protein